MTKGTSKSSKMGKDKLIAKLDEWFETVSDYGEEEDGQAYLQIKQLIESHPDPPADEEVEELVALLGRVRGLIAKLPPDEVNPLFPIHERFADEECQKIDKIKHLLQSRQPKWVNDMPWKKIHKALEAGRERIEQEIKDAESNCTEKRWMYDDLELVNEAIACLIYANGNEVTDK